MSKEIRLTTGPVARPYSALLGELTELLEQARRAAARSVNAVMTATYWEIGRRIVEFEQRGHRRAPYGADLLGSLTVDLTRRFGRGFSRQNLQSMRLFQQAVDKGDITFFELAYLEVQIKTPKKLTAVVTLKDFVIPNTELIPEDVRKKIKKWSDYVDYWAVDWDFQNDTFIQGWVTYRTRKDRTLALTSDPHTYEKAGQYRILVKVVDIFGNDTSQAFEVEVK
jgi:hypothetical protein